MIDYSMLQEFITEAGEHLDEMETDLLQLEKEPENREILNDIFREVHSIKGAAEYVGLEKMSELSHKLENLLEIMRQGKVFVNASVIDTLIDSRDRMLFLIRDLEAEKIEKTDIEDILQQIRLFSGEDKDPKDSENDGISENFLDPDSGDPSFESQRPVISDEAQENEHIQKVEKEVYEEDHDSELFEIFVEQMKEHISSIGAKCEKLQHAKDASSLLSDILRSIESLKTSANYMGYERLVEIYAGWENEAKEAQESISLGITVSYEFMDRYMEMVLVRFPQMRSVLMEPMGQKSQDTICKKNEFFEKKDESDDFGFMEAVEREFNLFQDEDDWQDDFAADSAPKNGKLRENDADTVIMANKPETSVSFNEKEVDTVDLNELDTLFDNEKLYSNLDKAFDDALKNTSQPREIVDVEKELFSSVESTPDELPTADLLEDNIEEAVESIIKDSQEKMVSEHHDSDEITRDLITRRQKKIFNEGSIKKTLRVDSYKIDSLMNQVGELVVSRAWFSQLFNEMREFQQYLKENVHLEKKEMKQVRGLTFRLSEATLNLGRVANELQEGIMKVRMIPIAHLFNRYPRMVRDLVKDTDKDIRLEIRGEDTELDKMIIEEISDPLVHIIRNAVDHGIETVEQRKMFGKPDFGTLILEAYHESNHVVIEIKDDGKGIDSEKIKKTAVEKGFVQEEELVQMTQKEIISLIMKPGFSTAGHVTHTSGRGVGMDVVRKNVEKLNGSIEIETQTGEQTRFRIKIPLTLAIIPALLVKVGQDLFTIPLTNVEETLRIFTSETSTIEGTEVIHLRDSTLPLVRLSDLFGRESDTCHSDKQFVVVVTTGFRRVGLVVDALIGQEEVVIKPLVDYLQESSGFSGATILGDGRISLILDVYELVNLTIDRRTQKLTSMSYSP